MKADELCKSAPDNIRPQVETLARAVYAMQRKIEEQIPIYDKLPIAQTATTTQGEKVLKNNPAMQEFRNTVRDYATSLSRLDAIINAKHEPEEETAPPISSLETLRARFKVV